MPEQCNAAQARDRYDRYAQMAHAVGVLTNPTSDLGTPDVVKGPEIRSAMGSVHAESSLLEKTLLDLAGRLEDVLTPEPPTMDNLAVKSDMQPIASPLTSECRGVAARLRFMRVRVEALLARLEV